MFAAGYDKHTATASVSTLISSARSQRATPSTIKTVVTVPPWAKDEPPSPDEESSPKDIDGAHLSISRPQHRSDAVSERASSEVAQQLTASRWWVFARPRQAMSPNGGQERPSIPRPMRPERKGLGLRGRSMIWLSPYRRGSAYESGDVEKGLGPSPSNQGSERRNQSTMRMDLPVTPANNTFTVAYNRTPGWDSPWSPADLARARSAAQPNSEIPEENHNDMQDEQQHTMTPWGRRRKRIRVFVLNNTYVPLLFRFTNLCFITAALAVAIRIRLLEKRNGILGVIGSSPTLAIIFAPITLVYVLAAIYLEYFGRPLGLWNTSAKLGHTLCEVLFICAWSAALSLCFDNFFVSILNCASTSSIAWYSELPRPATGLPTGASPLVDMGLCDDQLALIVLVAVALIMNCTNLVISLYRIFEKIKYHPGGSTFS